MRLAAHSCVNSGRRFCQNALRPLRRAICFNAPDLAAGGPDRVDHAARCTRPQPNANSISRDETLSHIMRVEWPKLAPLLCVALLLNWALFAKVREGPKQNRFPVFFLANVASEIFARCDVITQRNLRLLRTPFSCTLS